MTEGPTASEIGRKGGKAGKGAAKRRSAEHYRKMVEARDKKAPEKPPEPHRQAAPVIIEPPSITPRHSNSSSS